MEERGGNLEGKEREGREVKGEEEMTM